MAFMKKITAAALAAAIAVLAGCSGAGTTEPADTTAEPTAEPVDYTVYPYYVEDYESLEYSEDTYSEKISTPYWFGNVIYNEIALPFVYDDGSVYATLSYLPVKIVSVMDQSLQVTYEEGKDYTVDYENGRIVIPEGSSIPTISIDADKGVNPPDGYELVEGMPDNVSKYVVWQGSEPFVYTESSYFYARYISVTYVYDMSALPDGIFAEYDENVLPKTHAKLAANEDLSIVVFGDSIAAGCSSTGEFLSVRPRTPGFATQIKRALANLTEGRITMKNYALGGSDSSYLFNDGKKQLEKGAAVKPDLCIIAYGMNDQEGSESAFKQNIQGIMDAVKAENPDVEFILVNSFTSNPSWLGTSKFTAFEQALEEIRDGEAAGSVSVVNMYPVSEYFLDKKKFCEISSSNANHPNDYMHRIYAMNIMAVLYDYMGSSAETNA